MSTDHKALAEEQLDFITDEYTREPHIHTNVIEYTGIAQVHATLYAAEQQRLANLIALGFGTEGRQIREGLCLA